MPSATAAARASRSTPACRASRIAPARPASGRTGRGPAPSAPRRPARPARGFRPARTFKRHVAHATARQPTAAPPAPRSPIGTARFGKTAASSRPTIRRISSARSTSLHRAASTTARRRAGRSRGRRSAAARPAGARCRRSRRPRACSSRMTRNRFSTSRSLSDAVGSSMIRIRAFAPSAGRSRRAAAPASSGSRTTAFGEIDAPDPREQLRRPAAPLAPPHTPPRARQLQPQARCSPPRSGRGTAPAAGRWPRSPSRCAVTGSIVARPAARQSRACPRPAECAPVMILISVDLPAPFSPTSAWTSPARSSNDTSRSACTPPNDLLIELSRASAGSSEQRQALALRRSHLAQSLRFASTSSLVTPAPRPATPSPTGTSCRQAVIIPHRADRQRLQLFQQRQPAA